MNAPVPSALLPSALKLSALALLPHLNRLDSHTTFITLTPSGQPRILRLPEVPCGRRTTVYPWLFVLSIAVSLLAISIATDPAGVDILEPPILRANSDIKNKVKLLIERRDTVSSLEPRIGIQRAVAGRHTLEVTLLPEGILVLEFEVEDLLQSVVGVHEDVVLGPFETKGVEALGIVGAS